MITDGILYVFQGLINFLLSPLSVITIAVDFIASITVVQQFLQVVSYLFPWGKVLPLIAMTIGMFIFRLVMSIIKLILDFIPFE